MGLQAIFTCATNFCSPEWDSKQRRPRRCGRRCFKRPLKGADVRSIFRCSSRLQEAVSSNPIQRSKNLLRFSLFELL